MDWDMFFVVHDGLPREGPGDATDIAWALGVLDARPGGTVCDLACGPGGDSAALLAALPEAQVLGIDKRERFIHQARTRHAGQTRLSFDVGDMAELPDHALAPFDGIWCAGALYFLGLELGPSTMARALKPGGWLAFSEPCYFTRSPSAAAQAFWEGAYDTQYVGDVVAKVEAAGFDVRGHRPVSHAGWEAYYQPIEARVATLRDGAHAALTAMLDHELAEAAAWRATADETGYVVIAARWPG